MRKLSLFFLICLFLVSANFVSAATASFLGGHSGTSRYVQYQQPDFRHYYSSAQLRDYWPILSDEQKDLCEGRQDLLIQVAPAGCQPAVVRSDLLAEQNVPVFCQLDALRVNPLIDIKKIRNIHFTKNYPKEIVDVGFHPARAALRSRSELLGSPFLNNIGYAVVVLRRQANESGQPTFVNFTLQAQVDYHADNALGVGTGSFYLRPTSDNQWAQTRLRQSFFNGRYFIRLDEVDERVAKISIYYGDRKVSSTTLTKGSRAERLMYLPGSYCQLGLRAYFDRTDSAELLAQLQVGEDLIDVVQGGRFANNRCSLRSLSATGSDTGRVDISCGSQSFSLELSSRHFAPRDRVYLEGNESAGLFEIVSFNNKKGTYLVRQSPTSPELEVNYTRVYSTEEGRLAEVEYESAELKSYFKKTLETYRELARDYPLEKRADSQSLVGIDSFGQLGLERAINLAETLGKQRTATELINLYLEIYPDAQNQTSFSDRLRNHYHYDSSSAVAVVDINGESTTVRLRGIIPPAKLSHATFVWGQGTRFDVDLQANHSLNEDASLIVTSLDNERARVTVTCGRNVSFHLLSLRTRTQDSSEQRTANVCGALLRLESISLEEYAHIRLVPEARGPTVQTNFSVGVGIEQRAIKLAPDKIEERIANLNKTLAKWESLSKGLGNVVKTMKAACFATAGVLTVKNFVTGLEGTALARQKIMRGPNGWTEYCRNRVNAKDGGPSYSSIGACYKENSARIDGDVDVMESLIQEDNRRIHTIESNYKKNSGLLGSYVDGEKAKNTFVSQELRKYDAQEIILRDGTHISVSNLTREVPGGGSALTYQETKDLKLYLDLRARSGESPVAQALANETLQRIALSATERIASDERRTSLSSRLGEFGKFVPSYSSRFAQRGEWSNTYLSDADISRFGLDNTGLNVSTPAQVIAGDNGQNYLVILKSAGDGDSYGIDRSYKLDDRGTVVGGPIFGSVPGLTFSTFRKVSRTSCANRFAPNAAEMQFYETEPYKGLPALVPFDLEEGWYAGTRQTVAAFGDIKVFQSSGRPVSFWVCNVGHDGRPDFFVSGFDDDICQQFNLETGAPLNKFSCLSESETREVVDRAVRALEDASQQRSQGAASHVKIEGQSIKVGSPAVNIPGTQCQDFMSPDDCRLLFNVCDPVICPASRCNLGGAYPVTDVIQTGIVGSVLLCLPNWNEGVYVPVCLSGIKAGIDGYISVLKSHKQCLEENLESGKYIGVCDQISAIYMCEFFWRQAAPVANVLLPKLVESLYGQGGARGGGEYATIQSSWDNAQQSVNYFTQTYAANSFKAFNLRSVSDAGGEFCKAFVSAKAPTQFESLIEPDSPPQFHAWFSQIPYSDATVPATAHYKVFYHIFAGNDQGVSYQVYLKDPPQTSYYQSTSSINVATDYVPRGQYATDSRDFTAPAGYQQLCVRVNDKEECGFKQVTTSFALNAIRDEFVKDELTRTDISTEKDCVSGRANPSALLNPNLQEVGQEALDPAIYNRGVTRICATDNPGRSTDPSRFVKVGVCDDARVGCWLDKQSVDRAITINNEGVRNETLATLTELNKEQLKESEEFRYGEGEDTDIRTLGDSVLSKRTFSLQEAGPLLARAEVLFAQVIVNSQKAELLFIQGALYEAVTRGLWETREQSSSTSASSSRESAIEPWTVERAVAFLDYTFTPGALLLSESSSAFESFVASLIKDKVITQGDASRLPADDVKTRVEALRALLVSKNGIPPGITPEQPSAEQTLFSLTDFYTPTSTRDNHLLDVEGARTNPPIFIRGERLWCDDCGPEHDDLVQIGTLRLQDENLYRIELASSRRSYLGEYAITLDRAYVGGTKICRTADACR